MVQILTDDKPKDLPESVEGNASAFFERVVHVAPVILYVFDLKQMRNVWVNRSICSLLGYSEDDIAAFGENIFQELMHPDDLARYPAHSKNLVGLADGERAIFQYRMNTKAGNWRWLQSEEMPFARGPAGDVVQIIGSASDITDMKTREAQSEMISSEMSHRVKNMFSVINSIVRLTARHETELTTAAQKLSDRITALSTAHSIARSPEVVAQASAHELIRRVLEPFMESNSIVISGDDPSLIWDQITPLSLILHELGTNALKYGAFADPEGRLEVDVASVSDMISVKWYEYCDPIGKIEGPRGFGTRMIDGSIAQLGGTCVRNLTPEGKRVELTFKAKI